MNITINTGAATEDALQIDKLVDDMAAEMEELDRAIKNTIPAGIETAWSDTLRSNWESYYKADVPAAMADMKLSASNLRAAISQALGYSNEK